MNVLFSVRGVTSQNRENFSQFERLMREFPMLPSEARRSSTDASWGESLISFWSVSSRSFDYLSGRRAHSKAGRRGKAKTVPESPQRGRRRPLATHSGGSQRSPLRPWRDVEPHGDEPRHPCRAHRAAAAHQRSSQHSQEQLKGERSQRRREVYLQPFHIFLGHTLHIPHWVSRLTAMLPSALAQEPSSHRPLLARRHAPKLASRNPHCIPHRGTFGCQVAGGSVGGGRVAVGPVRTVWARVSSTWK